MKTELHTDKNGDELIAVAKDTYEKAQNNATKTTNTTTTNITQPATTTAVKSENQTSVAQSAPEQTTQEQEQKQEPKATIVESAQTGDNSPISIFIVGACICGLTLAGLIGKKRKSSK